MVNDADREELAAEIATWLPGLHTDPSDWAIERGRQMADVLITLGWSKGGKPVADREALARLIAFYARFQPRPERSDFEAADALLAPDGPLRSEAEVKAEALEESAEIAESALPVGTPKQVITQVSGMIRSRAAELREGR